jgi:hypothetical protein
VLRDGANAFVFARVIEEIAERVNSLNGQFLSPERALARLRLGVELLGLDRLDRDLWLNDAAICVAVLMASDLARGGRIRACRVCGCTDARACPGGCYWIAEDLCSACAPAEAA